MKKIIIAIFVMFCCTTAYGQQWIAAQTLSPPVVEVPSVPSVTYTVPAPTVTYTWVPYYHYRQVIVERPRWCFFFKKERVVVSQPFVNWVYAPVYNY